MIVRIKGKKIITTWSVKDNKQLKEDGAFIFTGKPTLESESKVDSWSDICSYEGDTVPTNEKHGSAIFDLSWSKYINVSEDESVAIEKKIFRADLGEIHVFTDKIIKESTEDKASSEKEYDNIIKEFNKTIIESDDKLLSYCKLHRLNLEDTDCIELFKLVYNTSNYVFADGKIKAGKMVGSSSYAIADIGDVKIHYMNGSSISTIDNYASTATVSVDGVLATSATSATAIEGTITTLSSGIY